MLATRQGLCRCSLMLLVCLCLWQHSWCCCTFLRWLFSRHLNELFKAPVLFQVNFFHGIPNPEMRTFDAAPYLEKIKAWSCRFHWAFHGHVPLDFRPHGWETCRAFQAEIDVFQPHVVASASKGGWIGSSWFVLHFFGLNILTWIALRRSLKYVATMLHLFSGSWVSHLNFAALVEGIYLLGLWEARRKAETGPFGRVS